MLLRKVTMGCVGLLGPSSSAKAERIFGRRAAVVLVLLLFSVSSVGAAGGASGNVEKIAGTVIAYDYVKSWIPCYRGECEGALIVRIDSPGQNHPRYVRVDFRYANGNPPRRLVRSKRRWRFELIRTKDLDEPISEFIEYERESSGRERKVPIWRMVSGAEGEKLPFGETIPSYSLTKNGFKQIGKE